MEENPTDVPNSPPEEAIPIPARPVSPLNRPLNLGALDTPIDLLTCRTFLSLSGGSILYCLSAMCVVYGIANILGPAFARTLVLTETLPCIAALNGYELALLTVLVVIVVWQNVTDDAISLLVLVAIFLVVSGIALTTIANSQPKTLLLVGGSCFALAMVKLFVLRRFVGVRIGPLLWTGLAVLLGWNFLTGALLARATATETVGRQEWLLSWLVLLAGGLLVFLDMLSRRDTPDEASGAPVPFLRRPAMSWVFAIVLLAAMGVHQRSLAYVFDADSTFMDYLPLVCIISLCLVQLAVRLRSRATSFEAALAALPWVVFLFALLGKPVLPKPTLGIELIEYAPLYLGLTGLMLLLMGLRPRCRPLLSVVPFYALGVVLTMTFTQATLAALSWKLTAGLLVVGLLIHGIRRRSPAFCVLAVLVGSVGFSWIAEFEPFIKFCGLTHLGALIGLMGLGTLAVALAFGRMPSQLLVATAAGVMLCAFDFLPAKLGSKDLLAGGALLILAFGVWLRLRHWPGVIALSVPVAYRLVVVSVLLKSWRYVVLGFVLLLAGAWMSIRKGKRAKALSEADATEADSDVGDTKDGAEERT